MKRNNPLGSILGLLLTILYLSACGPSQAEIDATITQIAAKVLETQTAAAPTSTSTPILGDTMLSPRDGMTLVYVPAGEFTMGSDADDSLENCQEFEEPFSNIVCERNWYEDSEPGHTVYLDAYWIDQTEVTNAQYQKCVAVEECDPPDSARSFSHIEYYGSSEYADYPVIYVSWRDARSYCEWAKRRLPTEAEWEKAARGSEGWVYPWGNTFDGERLNFCDSNCRFGWASHNYDDGYGDTAPVGSYLNGVSPYGALDMAGNVWEWVADWYDSDYYSNSPSENPIGPPSGESRVLRGGSWLFNGHEAMSVYRNGYFDPVNAHLGVGFRCASNAASP